MYKNRIKQKFLTKLIGVIFIIAPIICFSFYTVNAQGIDSGYEINNMTSNIYFGRDNVKVEESLDINFQSPKHGIYRYLPAIYEYHSEDSKTNVTSRLQIKVNSVKNKSGHTLRYDVLNVRDNILNQKDPLLGAFYNVIQIKIGEPDQYVEGEQNYVINYEISNFPNSSAPFVYGLTGTGWSADIKNYQGNLEYQDSPTKLTCQEGVARETNFSSCTLNKVSSNKYTVTASNINPASGVQITAEGLKFNHNTSDTILFLEEYWYLPIPFILLALLIVYWVKTQRSPKGTGVITPQFGIPENLKPGEMGTIIDDSVDKVDVTATIIDLAVNGYIKIVNTSDNEKKPKFELQKQKDTDASLKPYESILMNALFKSGTTTTLESLKNGSLVDSYKSIQDSIYLWGIKERYFKRKPDKANSFIYAAIFTALALAPAYLLNLLSISVIVIIAVILLIPSLVLFFLREYKSEKGVLMKEKIEGLKLFIQYAKKDQLEMLNTPMNTIFEKYLPYAIAFGLHKSWMEAFKGMNLDAPSWYVGPNTGNFYTNLYFISYINSMSSSFNNAFTVPMSQSGSGFVGGVSGGIGGGFSGGGGGSW